MGTWKINIRVLTKLQLTFDVNDNDSLFYKIEPYLITLLSPS